jgi:hypothetical protein
MEILQIIGHDFLGNNKRGKLTRNHTKCGTEIREVRMPDVFENPLLEV